MKKNNKLLIVDDEERILSVLSRLLKKEGYEVFTATSGPEGLEILKREEIGVIVSDLMMPKMDGIQFLEEAGRIKRDVVKMLLTGHAKLDAAIAAINQLGVFGFIVKPWKDLVLISEIDRAFRNYNLVMENKRLYTLTDKQNRQLKEANEALEQRVKERTAMLEEAIEESILMLARVAEARDDDAEGHVHRVYSMVFDLCKELGIPDDKAERVSLFSMVHDIGKVKVSDSILEKDDAELTEEEMQIRRSHTVLGEQMLGIKPFYKIAREIARSHHEKWDGSGYPDGLKGEEIPLPARIVAVAHEFDRFTHKEPYKSAWGMERVLQEMEKMAGTSLDPRIVEKFLAMQKKRLAKRKGKRS